jgi:CHASE2 domain-containing sensor protein
MLPGALLMGAAILLYGWQAVDLIGLVLFFVAHVLMGWTYLVGGVCACPLLHPDLLKQNPFGS